MDLISAALLPLLHDHFGWHMARAKCIAGLIAALIKVRTVNLVQLAIALPGGALKDSKYKRIQRLLSMFHIDFSSVAVFIRLVPDGPADVRKTMGCRTQDQAVRFQPVQL